MRNDPDESDETVTEIVDRFVALFKAHGTEAMLRYLCAAWFDGDGGSTLGRLFFNR